MYEYIQNVPVALEISTYQLQTPLPAAVHYCACRMSHVAWKAGFDRVPGG